MVSRVVVERKDIGKCEELVLNAVATINNLSYYSVDGSAVTQRRLHITECQLFYVQLLLTLVSNVLILCIMMTITVTVCDLIFIFT